MKCSWIKNLVIFTGKQLCWCLLLVKLRSLQPCKFIKKRLLSNIKKLLTIPISRKSAKGCSHLHTFNTLNHYWYLFWQYIFSENWGSPLTWFFKTTYLLIKKGKTVFFFLFRFYYLRPLRFQFREQRVMFLEA